MPHKHNKLQLFNCVEYNNCVTFTQLSCELHARWEFRNIRTLEMYHIVIFLTNITGLNKRVCSCGNSAVRGRRKFDAGLNVPSPFCPHLSAFAWTFSVKCYTFNIDCQLALNTKNSTDSRPCQDWNLIFKFQVQ